MAPRRASSCCDGVYRTAADFRRGRGVFVSRGAQFGTPVLSFDERSSMVLLARGTLPAVFSWGDDNFVAGRRRNNGEAVRDRFFLFFESANPSAEVREQSPCWTWRNLTHRLSGLARRGPLFEAPAPIHVRQGGPPNYGGPNRFDDRRAKGLTPRRKGAGSEVGGSAADLEWVGCRGLAEIGLGMGATRRFDPRAIVVL